MPRPRAATPLSPHNLERQGQRRASTGQGWPAPVAWALAAAVGAPLGTLAVAADNVPVTGNARFALLLVSSGVSWGGAAVVLGAGTRRALAAAGSGLLALVCAVLAYYAVIDWAGTRPTASSASLIDAARVWGAAAVAGGSVLGVGGWCAHRGSATSRPLAWGAMGGLLASQGIAMLVGELGAGVGTAALALPAALIALPALIVVCGTRRHRPLLAMTVAVVTAVIAAVAWAHVQGSV